MPQLRKTQLRAFFEAPMLIHALNRVAYYRRRLYSLALQHWGGFGSCGAASFDPSVRIDNPGGMHIEDGVLVLRGGWLYCIPGEDGAVGGNLRIGANTYIGHYSHITCSRYVRLGPDCLLANYVYISDSLHGYEDINRPPLRQPLKIGRVEIGEATWIGEHVCIFGDVKIGRHAVIGANSVVTNCEIPDYSVAAGAPARVVRTYDPARGEWARARRVAQLKAHE